MGPSSVWAQVGELSSSKTHTKKNQAGPPAAARHPPVEGPHVLTQSDELLLDQLAQGEYGDDNQVNPRDVSLPLQRGLVACSLETCAPQTHSYLAAARRK